jgi:hypothetical protein
MTNGAGEGLVRNVRLSNDTCDNTMLRNLHYCSSSGHDYTSVELLLQHLRGCELQVVPDTDIINNHDYRNAVQLLDHDLSECDARACEQKFNDRPAISRLEVIQEENSVDAELLLDALSECDARVCEQKFNDRPAISRLEVIQEESSVDAKVSESSQDEEQLYLQ